MKLHELTPGQRFEFKEKHAGKTFEVTYKDGRILPFIEYKDVATGEVRSAYSNRKTFRMEVLPVTTDRLVSLTADDLDTFTRIVEVARQVSAEDGDPESVRNEINRLYIKVTGMPARRPEGGSGDE